MQSGSSSAGGHTDAKSEANYKRLAVAVVLGCSIRADPHTKARQSNVHMQMNQTPARLPRHALAGLSSSTRRSMEPGVHCLLEYPAPPTSEEDAEAPPGRNEETNQRDLPAHANVGRGMCTGAADIGCM